MSQMDKAQIEELLSSYIDDQLSERQCNEVKRLLQHDPQVAEMLTHMQKQKDLFNALPVEAAPATMLDDIKASLERNMLLDRTGREIKAVAGPKRVYARRVLAVAAMLLLPLSLLAIVVFSIFAPPSIPPGKVAVNVTPDVMQPGTNIETADSDIIVELLPENFNAALQLSTTDTSVVNSFVEKAIYSNGLANNTVSSDKDTTRTYRVSSTPKLITALLRDMEAVWTKCRTNRLMVYDDRLRLAAVVNNITAVQILNVFEQAAPEGRIALAKIFAGINPAVGSFDATGEFDPSIPIKPVLTGPEKSTTTDDQSQTDERITLIITIAGL
jgi:hypothetical protein